MLTSKIINGYDEYYDNVVLLLHGDGTNGSTVFTDSSKYNQVVSYRGNANISTANLKFGSGAISYDGNGDDLYIPSTANFAMGTGDFTCELYFKVNLQHNFYLLNFNVAAGKRMALEYSLTDRSFNIFSGNNTSTIIKSSIVDLVVGKYYYIVMQRYNNLYYIWLDGKSIMHGATLSVVMNWTNSQLNIGSAKPDAASNYINGYMDEVRITKGVARYKDSSYIKIQDRPWDNNGKETAVGIGVLVAGYKA